MLEFRSRVEPQWVILSATEEGRPADVERWPALSDPSVVSLTAKLWNLVEDEEALADANELHVPHRHVAALSPKERKLLGLPDAPPVTLSVQHNGTLESAQFGLDYSWYMTSGRAVMGPTRDGAFLTIGRHQHLLPLALYEVVEAIDAFNRIPATRPDDRAAAWVVVQAFLPTNDAEVDELDASRYLREVRIAHASAFSLKPFEVEGRVDFDPVLFARRPRTTAGADEDQGREDEPSPLLPDAYQDIFANERFRGGTRARGRYVLADGWILVLSPELRRAMEVVRSAQAAGGEVARDFVRNPRGYLREALGDDLEEHLIDDLFQETRDYSDRVQEIGLWHKKVIPWVQVGREPWLPPDAVGLVIDGTPIQLPPGRLSELIENISAAIERREGHVVFEGVEVPASEQTLAALLQIERASHRSDNNSAADEPDTQQGIDDPQIATSPERHVLIVKNNFDEVLFNSDPSPRAPPVSRQLHLPALKSEPKSHQDEGIQWLQSCWQTGWTGALLADDMGLGKTFQTLAFLAWLRAAMASGLVPQRPMLVVAPTGLLRNWEKEHDNHLHAPGLGLVERVYDASLKGLRLTKGSELELGRPLLDVERLRAADWVLTTYETLRDYQHSFGQIQFSIAVFDEVQKIKTPGTQITDAAQAMQADFVLALTGTPIENRLADLWCIMDTLHPGALGGLKAFSNRYEAEPSEADLRQLKEVLSLSIGGRPPVMLRRMKDDLPESLPPKTDHVIERDMPAIQANAYSAVVAEARQRTGRGHMLEVLQAMRQISLAPAPRSMSASDGDYIRSSGRLMAAFEVLDEIHRRNEKVIIFVEYREAQAELSGIVQRRYNLLRPPMIIAGNVSGAQRQIRVDQFQSSDDGFDVIILSPKAGGVGITLTAANNVIHLTRWWNPAVEDQSTDRCYRIGQSRAVNVYYPMSVIPGHREHSFDRRLDALLSRKRTLSRDMLMPTRGTIQDVQNLFDETVSG